MDLIHYGTNKFNAESFKPVKNRDAKPVRDTGFWGCPVDSEWSWKDWCVSEDFDLYKLETFIEFKYSGSTIIIDSMDDLLSLPWIPHEHLSHPSVAVDFEQLARDGYDAVYLTIKGFSQTRLPVHRIEDDFMKSTCIWDCESVLIMNPDSILEELGA